jgi:probable phosphoglycerate mutase
MPELLLARHGETEWSLDGRHTGTTDLPLTENGRRRAGNLASRLEGRRFALVLTSPMRRAIDTCRLAGLGDQAQVRDDLHEWNYGEYEGITTAQIHEHDPGWSLWRDGCPNGETAADVGARADRLIAEAREADGDVIFFGHGHMLRVVGARWVDLSPAEGGLLGLGTGSLCTLGYEHESPIVVHWNEPVG